MEVFTSKFPKFGLSWLILNGVQLMQVQVFLIP